MIDKPLTSHQKAITDQHWQQYSTKIGAELLPISHSPIKNYIIPGTESRIIQRFDNGEIMRAFISTRHQNQFVIPHSHRYNLHCKVVRGCAWNTLWEKTDDLRWDTYTSIAQSYSGQPGLYSPLKELSIDRWQQQTRQYYPGETYYMDKAQVHSIKFAKDSIILLHETGRDDRQGSIYLEPNIDGKTIHTLVVQDWMFQGVSGDR